MNATDGGSVVWLLVALGGALVVGGGLTGETALLAAGLAAVAAGAALLSVGDADGGA
ncbi:hypothetical protein GCM10027435_05870 [Haloparvum alkalitolerans]|uniref:hypothetical protein n=1 Tax=Haloparvum alkalitolerans TaxID=1042953 RepID=UPI003CF49E62